MHTSSEYELVDGRIRRSKKWPLVRGLNQLFSKADQRIPAHPEKPLHCCWRSGQNSP